MADTDDNAVPKRRTRGTGRVWQIGPIWWIQYYAHGRQVRETSGSRKRVVAERLLQKRLAEKMAGVLRVGGAQRLRYEQMRDNLYAKYRNESKRSLRRAADGTEYVGGVRPHLDTFFGGWRASEITTYELRRFVDARLANGASNGAVNNLLALLRSMFNVAWKDGWIERNDVPHFPMFPPSAPRDIRLNPAEFERLYAALPPYLRAPTRLAYTNGLRREEVFGLRWTEIDWTAQMIQLPARRTKTGRPRMTPLVGGVLAELKSLFVNRRNGAEFVFEHDGHRIGDFRKTWRAALRRAKLPERFVFHGLRYCAASNLTSANVPQIVAQQITGHETASIFRRYNLTSAVDLVSAGEKVAAYIENRAKTGQMADSERTETDERKTLTH